MVAWHLDPIAQAAFDVFLIERASSADQDSINSIISGHPALTLGDANCFLHS
jgi:hypothetical protein